MSRGGLQKSPLDTYKKHPYNKTQSIKLMTSRLSTRRCRRAASPKVVRACTGFDGGFEVREAIRRLLDCVPTGKLNINADNKLALAA